MTLKNFVFIQPTLSTPEMGAGLILCTKEPFYIGRVVRFKDDAESINLVTKPPLVYSNVLGYSIYIVFEQSLTGKLRVQGTNWEENLQFIFDEMATWYFEEKVKANLVSFKRFKI